MRLSQVARKLNVGITTIVDFLGTKGIEIDGKPNTKITDDQYKILLKEFQDSALDKEEADELTIGAKASDVVIDTEKAEATTSVNEEEIAIKNVGTPEESAPKKEEPKKEAAKDEYSGSDKVKLQGIKVLGKIDIEGNKKAKKSSASEEKKEAKEEKPQEKEPVAKKEAKTKTSEKADSSGKSDKPAEKEQETISGKADELKGLTVLGKIELPKEKKKPQPVASSDASGDAKKRKRKRVRIDKPVDVKRNQGGRFQGKGQKGKPAEKEEISSKEIQEKIKATMAKMNVNKGKTNRSKYKREKRKGFEEQREEEMLQQMEDSKVLQVTEFVSAQDLANLMDVSVNDVISTCMSLGLFVSINQRLDAETIQIIADEFDYNVEFTTIDEDADTDVGEEEDDPADLKERAPIVTIMGHVDHGKTSLLDYIRNSKVTEGEAGGITQHVGAYSVKTDSGKKVTFLDTPGHEAFTAMRARGAKLTDIVILVVAADDDVMPQTKEAINHAQIANVPIIVAINKIDKPTANPDKIKEQLANLNILVEDWGGKYQCQHVSAKTGDGIDDLLEKILIESEVMALTANPDKNAVGAVVEASLDKGRGYVTNILVQAGTLKIGDILVAGAYHGKVKAMLDHRGKKLKEANPSTPVQILGLAGAPQAGDKFFIADSEKEAKDVTNKRAVIMREQSVRTKKHLTLDEIGRRLAIGNFKELNLIIKGDVDGSVEALTDSLLKLSTDEVAVNVIHKGVGQITESDVLLATASDAIIIGFQVRPSAGARKIADQEEIEIKLYSIIYKTIDDIKDALEGMLEPDTEEVIIGNVEVRETFKISKIGTIAGCYVLDGHIKRDSTIRLIREGIVKYEGEIGALKRFKDDVAEVKHSYECGLSIKNFNDIEIGDIIEAYEIKEVKKKLK